MKGLILKDVYGCRFQIIGAFALMFLPMLIAMFGGGGLLVSNNQTPDSTKMIVGMISYGAVNYMSIVICSSFYLNTLGYDEKSGWSKMQRAMPLTGGQIIGGKILGSAAIVGSLTLISMGFNAFSAYIFEIPFEPMLALPICIGLMQMITLLPTIVLGYRFGAKSVTWVYFVIMVIAAAGMIALTAAVFVGDISANVLRIVAYAGVPALSAAVIVVCYITGKKAVTVDI